MQLQCDAVEGGVLYPEEVSAYILAELLSSAQAYLGRPVENAVISVPAYFGSEQREATIEAGRLAGLTKIKLIRQAICILLLKKVLHTFVLPLYRGSPAAAQCLAKGLSMIQRCCGAVDVFTLESHKRRCWSFAIAIRSACSTTQNVVLRKAASAAISVSSV